jgi:hypothetical protein
VPRESYHVRVDYIRARPRNGVHVRAWSLWSDPIWKGLRIVSFISAGATLTVLTVYLAGARSWLVLLETAVATNVAIMVALVIRTFVLHAKYRRAPKS